MCHRVVIELSVSPQDPSRRFAKVSHQNCVAVFECYPVLRAIARGDDVDPHVRATGGHGVHFRDRVGPRTHEQRVSPAPTLSSQGPATRAC